MRAIGASNFTRRALKQALDTSRRLKLPRYEVLQPKYNLYDRSDYEGALADLCTRKRSASFRSTGSRTVFSPANIAASADFGKSAARGSRMGGYLNERGKRILAALDGVSAKHNVKPAAIALAWLIARPLITAPIASATKPEQLEDFAAAARIKLDRDDLEQLNVASAR